MLLLNGNIITMDSARPRAEAVAVGGDRIAAVGSNEEARAAGVGGPEIDLAGRTLIHGFNDAHLHLLYAGQIMLDVDLSPEAAPDIPAIQRQLAERARITPPGEWVMGYRYDVSKLAENRHPTRHDLDAATTDHPIAIYHVCSHIAVVNSAALKRIGFTRESADPAGGRLGRDPATGDLDGRLYEVVIAGEAPAGQGPPQKTVEQNRRALELIGRKALSVGITCATDAQVSTDWYEPFRLSAVDRTLPIRARLLLAARHLDAFLGMDLPDNPWLRVIGVKAFADGAIAGRTACLSAPYEGTDDCGILCIDQAELNRIARVTHDAGLQCCVHANGDRAIAMTLDAFEAAMGANPRSDPRHRLEHGTVMTPALIERAARLGVVVAPFASYVWHHGEKMGSYGERIHTMFAVRSMLDAGITVAGSTDHPCAPIDPLLGVQSMVLRQSRSGEPLGPGQRVSVEEALRVYTAGSAYASFEEAAMGMVRPGMLADLTVLGADPTAVDPAAIKDIPVDTTIVGGEVAYTRER